MKCKAYGKEHDVYIMRNEYASNRNLAISVYEENGEPFAILTVNLAFLMPDYAFVDVNNCPWAEDFIRDNNLGTFTGTKRQSGFCEYPLYHFPKSV